MKNLTKAINRLARAVEIQNKQLEQLRTKDNLTTALGMAMLAMMFNSPWNKPDADFYKNCKRI